MGRDRSLEEFFDATSEESAASGSDGDDRSPEPKPDANGASESGAEADSDSESGSQEPEADDTPPESPDDIEPAAVTYRWDPSNVECAECGAAVEQLWSGESGQVCAECKGW